MFLTRRTHRADWPATVEPASNWEEPQVWMLIDLGDPQTAVDEACPPVTADEP